MKIKRTGKYRTILYVDEFIDLLVSAKINTQPLTEYHDLGYVENHLTMRLPSANGTESPDVLVVRYRVPFLKDKNGIRCPVHPKYNEIFGKDTYRDKYLSILAYTFQALYNDDKPVSLSSIKKLVLEYSPIQFFESKVLNPQLYV